MTTWLGTGPSVTETWDISTDEVATFYPASNRGTRKFIQSWFGQTQLVARTTPLGDNPRTATFDISSVEQAVGNFRKSCDWPD